MMQGEASELQDWFVTAQLARMDYLARREKVLQAEYGVASASNTLYYRILSELTEDAIRVCADEPQPNINRLNWHFNAVDEQIFSYMHAFAERAGGPPASLSLDFWSHVYRPIVAAKSKKAPLLYRAQINEVACAYINGPYRSRLADRVWTDALIAAELFNFVEAMLRPREAWWMGLGASLKTLHPAIVLIAALSVEAAILGAIAFAFNWAYEADIIGIWGNWIAVGCLLIWLIQLALGLLLLPSRWVFWRNSRKRIMAQIESMLGAYIAVEGQDLVSPSYVLHCILQASDKGVSWPSSLMVLLDDVIARREKL